MSVLARRCALIATLAITLALWGVPLDVATSVASAHAVATADSADTTSAPDSDSAMADARAQGHRVEDLSQRSAESQVFANPDGSWSSETSTDPVRMQDDAGDWHDIDTTLVARDGGLAPKYAVTDVVLSDGGDKTFAAVTEDDKDLAWKWPTTLPTPKVDGDTATYENVAPGEDLVVRADATGFEHSIVLDYAPADGAPPVTVTTPITTDGAKLSENTDGGITIGNSADPVVQAPQPIVYDSSSDTVGDPASALVDASVGKTAAGTPEVTLTPDQDFLNDPATVYPVTIDPSYTTHTTGDTWAQTPNYTTPNVSSDELRAGTYDSGTHIARSFLHFSMDKATGKHVTSAKLVLRNWHSETCIGSAIRVRPTSEAWAANSLTWDNQPLVADSTRFVDFTPAYGSACAAGDATWNVTAMVDDWAQGRVPNYGFRIKAVDESTTNSWRRYRSGNYQDDITLKPRLDITYNAPPNTAGVPTFSPGGVGYTSSASPTLSALVTDPDAASSLTAVFDVLDGSDVVWSGRSAAVASGSVASTVVPSDALEIGKTYSVRVQVDDGLDRSAVYSTASMQVDADAAVVPAPVCQSPCSVLTPVTLLDTSTSSPLAAGEARTFSANIPAVSDQADIESENISIVVKGWTQSGNLTVYNSDYPSPKAPTVTYTGTNSTAGTTTSAQVMPSSANQLTVRNSGPSTVNLKVTATGWSTWQDADEAALDAASGDDSEEEDSGPADPSDTSLAVLDDADTPTDADLAASGFPTDNAGETSEACATNADQMQTCVAQTDDTQFASSMAAIPELTFTPSSTGVAAINSVSDSCSVASIHYSNHFSLIGRFNACRNKEFRLRIRDKKTDKVLGVALVALQERFDVDQKNTTIQHKWRFVLKGTSGIASFVNATSIYRCIKGCSMNSINTEFDSIDVLYPVGIWHYLTGNGVVPGFSSVSVRTGLDAEFTTQASNAVGLNTYSPRMRCDNVLYVASAGCVFPRSVPRFEQWRGPDGRAPETAEHIWTAQHKSPHWGAELLGGDPLTRAYGGTTKKLNRRKARQQCRAKKFTKSCDEWPFASTYEGCAVLISDCHVADIDKDDNSLGGAFLGRFYGKNRVLDGDRFWVKIH